MIGRLPFRRPDGSIVDQHGTPFTPQEWMTHVEHYHPPPGPPPPPDWPPGPPPNATGWWWGRLKDQTGWRPIYTLVNYLTAYPPDMLWCGPVRPTP